MEGTYEDPIILGRMSEREAIYSILEKNHEANKAILARQRLVDIKFLSNIDRMVYQGQIVVDEALVPDIEALSEYTTKKRKGVLKIDKMTPVAAYGWNDESSLEDNNSSGFNYMFMKGTQRLSLHAFGFALDINPRDNPIITNGIVSEPGNGLYAKNDLNTLAPDNEIVLFLKNRGFEWGGDWESCKDYHHFAKVIPTQEYIDYYIASVVTDSGVYPEAVIKRVEGLIHNMKNGNFEKTYAPNLLRLIEDAKVKDMLVAIIGMPKYLEFSSFINEKINDAKVRS